MFGKIATQLHLKETQVRSTITLLQGGASVPFIARYRKERTGMLDEVKISEIKDLYTQLTEFEARKKFIFESLEKQGVLTSELKQKINITSNIIDLEDIYLPYKPKKKTRASIAKEKGLEPLATIIFNQNTNDIIPLAKKYITKDITSIEEVLQGSRDIIAEWINENPSVRNSIRNLFNRDAWIYSKATKSTKDGAEKFKDYFEFKELLSKCPSHRTLALRRGESEGFLKVWIEPEESKAIEILKRLTTKNKTEAAKQVEIAAIDCYKRLLQPSIENEYASESKAKADIEAIKVFADNLRQLLLAAPLGNKRILAIDPGFRTGCKVVCLGNDGNIEHTDTIYPHPPQNDTQISKAKIEHLIDAYNIEAFAIGNGTAGRETQHFIESLKALKDIPIFMVNENGASIYSASETAREEFPTLDVTVRGTISIGRRLMDPLSELVKIDPKSIGVGQYQHDVDQSKLQNKLDEVVESCVNSVGVNVNIASKHLLKYVSGIGPQLAENIINYRTENGAFKNRDELKKVPRLGIKAFEQCAGFLRIPNAKNPLDNSAVHPESYSTVLKIAQSVKCSINDLLAKEELRKSIKIEQFITNEIGLPTLQDIMNELAKPGRDPRKEVKVFSFDSSIKTIEDIKTGSILPGIVTNITNFGAFVDIGVKQDGLVHISHLSKKFISNPNEAVKLGQAVTIKVLEVDIVRKRIQLSIKEV